MSGLEIAALVVAIASAFTGAATVFQGWQARKATKKAAKALSQSLTVGAPQVNEKYNQHLKQLGNRFAKGDGNIFLHSFNSGIFLLNGC